ncbi:MAG: hypothetical protein GXO79_00095 [Chlorobi bacterium]|nr:hypothetical protein [Chlorobiota bacterium]
MGDEYKIPRNLIRKIISKAPCFSSGENFNRYPGVITEGHETNCQYNNVILYIQNGHKGKFDFFESLLKDIAKIQSSRARKYRLFIFGFGNSKELQHEDKYFELRGNNIILKKKEIIDVLENITTDNKCSEAIIPALFPKSQGRNFYTNRTKINREDLLIIIGNKDEVYFNETLKSQLKLSIRKHILLIEFDNNTINYIFYPKELIFCKTKTTSKMNFKRNFKNIPSLMDVSPSTNLFSSIMRDDCKNQDIFLTIRNGYLDFYHKGGRLFKYDKNGFQTHIKYAAVITKGKDNYLTEKDLASYKLNIDFADNYKRIKENCANYSGLEAKGVSQLYQRYSYLSDSKIVVLDIEVSFKSLKNDKKQDRIDILLFNTKTKELQFVEAKHYSNKEIRSTKKPDVIEQIERYQEQIATNKASIIAEYGKYTKILNDIFGKNIPKPEKICKSVTLLIFGFDDDQKKRGLKKIESSLNKTKYYSKGDIKSIKIDSLWRKDCVEL